MAWALGTIAVVVVGVAFLLTTVGQIHRAREEAAHYRLSIRFWGGLALLGAITLVMLARPLVDFAWIRTEAGLVSMGLIAILPAFVIGAGARNAFGLWRASVRRRRALDVGQAIEGRVIDRVRWLLGQDIIAVIVEADVPRPAAGHEMTYRARDPERTDRRRFVETCPGDHWDRFEPGRIVTLRVDPHDPRTFALLLFQER